MKPTHSLTGRSDAASDEDNALGLYFLKCPKSRQVPEVTAAIVSFALINVSQRSVATQFRCGEIINNHFIANSPQCASERIFKIG